MTNNSISKKINIEAVLSLDKTSKDDIRNQAEQIASDVSKVFENVDFASSFKNSFSDIQARMTEQKSIFDSLTGRKSRIQEALKFAKTPEERRNLRNASKAIDKELKQNEVFQKERSKNIKEGLKEIGSKALEILSNIAKNIIEKMDEMAQYNVSGSIFGTSEAREKMLQYGTSEAETYGLSKTMSTLNLKSEEDLWYMNPNQREKFAQLIGRYTSKYQELANKDFFKSYEEFKLEFQLFKEELYYDLISVIVDNKDTIMSFLKLGVEAMKGIINFLGKIGEATGMSSRSVGDIISSYSNTKSNTSQTYSFNNTFNMNDTSAQSAQMFSANIMNTIKQLTQS